MWRTKGIGMQAAHDPVVECEARAQVRGAEPGHVRQAPALVSVTGRLSPSCTPAATSDEDSGTVAPVRCN